MQRVEFLHFRVMMTFSEWTWTWPRVEPSEALERLPAAGKSNSKITYVKGVWQWT
jgi:hypothetical protein